MKKSAVIATAASFLSYGVSAHCNATVPCDPGSVCLTTRRGNLCAPASDLPCEEDRDCPGEGHCFKSSGAAAGLCGGCVTDANCGRGAAPYCSFLYESDEQSNEEKAGISTRHSKLQSRRGRRLLGKKKKKKLQQQKKPKAY
jgi:hypothetical protein